MDHLYNAITLPSRVSLAEEIVYTGMSTPQMRFAIPHLGDILHRHTEVSKFVGIPALGIVSRAVFTNGILVALDCVSREI